MAEAARSIGDLASSDAYLECLEWDDGSEKEGFGMSLGYVNLLAASLRLRSRVHPTTIYDHAHVPDVGLAWFHC